MRALTTAWFQGMLFREPSPVEMEMFGRQVATVAPAALPFLAAAIIRTPECQAKTYAKLATALTGSVDQNAFAAWNKGAVGRIAVRRPLRLELIASPAFFERWGRSRDGWLKGLHQALVGRAPTALELAAWGLAMDLGMAREKVAFVISNSSESARYIAREMCAEVLGHLPDAKYEADIGLKLRQGAHEEDWLALLYASPEYLARHAVGLTPAGGAH